MKGEELFMYLFTGRRILLCFECFLALLTFRLQGLLYFQVLQLVETFYG
jgi:hypothetical protein